MAKSFESLAALATHFVETELVMARMLEVGLDKVLEHVEKVAKAEFGTYQPGVGPFPAWPELADATKDDRVAQGFSENDPLLRTGEARDSIEHQREGLEGVVGSADEKMVWFEFGTAKMPARPVLGPAAFLSRPAIEKLVGAAAVAGLIGADQIHAALGYDFRTKG